MWFPMCCIQYYCKCANLQTRPISLPITSWRNCFYRFTHPLKRKHVTQSKPLSFLGESTHCYCNTKQAIDQKSIVCQCFGTLNLEKKTNFQSKTLSFLGAIWHHTTSSQCKLRSYFRKHQALQCTLPKQLPIVVRSYHGIIRQAMHKHPDPFSNTFAHSSSR